MRRLLPGRVVRGVIRRLARQNRMAILCAPPLESHPRAPDGFSAVRVGPAASATDRDVAEEAMRAAGEPAGLVAPRLAHGDELFGWAAAGRVVSFGWVTYQDRVIGPVRLADAPGRVFLYNFHTLEGHRGQGLYPTLLLSMRSILGREGATELIIDVNVRNVPSARGIEKAGFEPVARFAFLTLLNRWCWVFGRTVSAGSVGRLF